MSYNIEIKFYRIKNSLRQKMEVCVEMRKEGRIRKLILGILHKECKYGNNYKLIVFS